MQGQVFVFLIAGYDTTATTLACASYYLALHPEIQEKLWQEIDEAFPDLGVSTAGVRVSQGSERVRVRAGQGGSVSARGQGGSGMVCAVEVSGGCGTTQDWAESGQVRSDLLGLVVVELPRERQPKSQEPIRAEVTQASRGTASSSRTTFVVPRALTS